MDLSCDAMTLKGVLVLFLPVNQGIVGRKIKFFSRTGANLNQNCISLFMQSEKKLSVFGAMLCLEFFSMDL